MRAAAGKFGGNLAALSIFLGIGFAYIRKKNDCSFCCGGGEQSEENESVLCLKRQSPERGKHFYFSSAKVLLLFDIRKFLAKKFIFNDFFLHISGKSSNFAATRNGGITIIM